MALLLAPLAAVCAADAKPAKRPNIVYLFTDQQPWYQWGEESQLVGAFTADGGRSWTPVEMAMQYTGPLILNAGIVKTEIQGQQRFLLPAHRNTLQKDPLARPSSAKRGAGVGAGIHFWGEIEQQANYPLGANLLIHSADLLLFQKLLKAELKAVKQAAGLLAGDQALRESTSSPSPRVMPSAIRERSGLSIHHVLGTKTP